MVCGLVAGSLLSEGVSAPITGIRTVASVSASASAQYSPADGHSPRLTHELSGPLTGTGVARPGSASRTAAGVGPAAAAANGLLNGVDVASFQHPNGVAINWTQVAGAGYTFAAIKATEGSYYVNPYYAQDAAAATAAGMYVAPYHFAIPSGSEGATKQALYAYTNAGNYKVGGHNLPLVLDIEYDPYSSNECYGLSAAKMVSWISSFISEATTLTGGKPIIYTPQAWWSACTGSSTAFGSNLLWVPAYSAGTPGLLPAGWGTWTMWQYTASGSVPGITGAVDLDYFNAGPQAEQTAKNASVSIQIQTLNAVAGQQVSYAATGLPPGVTMSPAGHIAGAPTTDGVYQVTVTPQGSGPFMPASVSFTWTVGPAVALAALATNGVPYARAPQLGNGTTWQSLGGTVIAPPAVAASPNPNGASPASPLFIAPGTNDLLYIRGVTGSWQRLSPNDASCLSAAAVITGSTLTVACEGLNHALYYDTATVPASGLPQFTNAWKGLGGTMSAGPAVAPVGGTLTFFIRGANGVIDTRTLTTNFAQAAWTCLGQPAAAQQAATGVTEFACQGTNHALYAASDSGAGWSAAIKLTGTLAAGPAVAATSETPVFAVVGTSQVVYERTPTTGYTSLRGILASGVEATALN